MASANLFQQYLQPARSAIDYENDYAKADQLRNANALQALSMQQAAAVNGQKNALRQAVQGGQIDLSNDAGQQQALTLAPDVAPGLIKTVQDSVTSRAQAQKDLGAANASNASASKTTQDTHFELIQHGIQSLTAAATPQQAKQAVIDGVHLGYWGMQDAQAKLAQIPDDPQQYQDWRIQQLKAILPVADMLKANSPTISTRNTGGATDTLASDPLTGKTSVVSSVKNTVSPDTVATQAGENSRAAAQRQTQLTIAGMSPDGSISPNLEAEAQLIASGRAAPPTGMAATRPAAAALMARVSQINPQFDATDYLAKTKAAKDFTSGNQGNAMRSFAVAGQHLDQLGQLVDALNNGDNQTINKVGNAISQWNGNTPVTNFDAAKDVVSKEVIKAIVGSGAGGVAERGELAQLMSNAKSPQQLKGIIQQYTSLMGAQHDALLAQRRAAGLPDSTLPNYGAAVDGAGTAPAGWKYLGPAPAGGQ